MDIEGESEEEKEESQLFQTSNEVKNLIAGLSNLETKTNENEA